MSQSRLDVCDLCWYFKDVSLKQCKDAFGGTYCRRHFIGIAEIQRGKNEDKSGGKGDTQNGGSI